MKVKDGKIKLGKNDIQLGNFILSKESQHYKMQDINGYWSVRVSFQYPMYSLIEECVKAKNYGYLETISLMLYMLSTTIPDAKMFEDIHEAYKGLIDRMKAEQDKNRDDAQALKDVQTAYEAKEELKKVTDGEPEGNTDR